MKAGYFCMLCFVICCPATAFYCITVFLVMFFNLEIINHRFRCVNCLYYPVLLCINDEQFCNRRLFKSTFQWSWPKVALELLR